LADAVTDESLPVGADPDDVALEQFVTLGPVEILLTASAGCGKTQALAARTAQLVAEGHVQPHQRILAASFSKKARDNLRTRLSKQLSVRQMGLVTVQNLHGVATRVLLAHGRMLGLDMAELTLPTKPLNRRLRQAAGVTWANGDAVDEILWSSKGNCQSDDEVLAVVEASGNPIALKYELLLRGENAVDYDDLLRHAGRLLQLEQVAFGYRQHFAAVVIDEVQDLSMCQLRMVQQLGADRVTYAGDPAQGIYSFTGADPDAVFADVSARCAESFVLTRSFRSSPDVLRAVNALVALQGAPSLRCAKPSGWGPSAGFQTREYSTLAKEADDVVSYATSLLSSADIPVPDAGAAAAATTGIAAGPAVSVGILARVGPRLRVIRAVLDAQDVQYTDWSAPLGDAHVLAQLREHAAAAVSLAGSGSLAASDALEQLCSDVLAADDVDGRSAVTEACDALREIIALEGVSLKAALKRCRVPNPLAAPVGPGLHLLNAHVGKGQEFDHVVAVGLEDGILPDFRAKDDAAAMAEELRALTVMVSRARASLLVTRSADVPAPGKNSSWLRDPSPWWATLEAAALI
jgi:DNA helicase-2/ATP-dependent DNA helicase PcrA